MAKRKTKAYSESYRKEAVRLADLPFKREGNMRMQVDGFVNTSLNQ